MAKNKLESPGNTTKDQSLEDTATGEETSNTTPDTSSAADSSNESTDETKTETNPNAENTPDENVGEDTPDNEESKQDEQVDTNEDKQEESAATVDTTTGEDATPNVTVDPTETAKPAITIANVAALLSSPDLTPFEKISALQADAAGDLKIVVTRLLSYQDNMGRHVKMLTSQTGSHQQYSLFEMFKYVCNLEDYNLFKTLFDVINIVFKENTHGAFSELMMHRFTTEWKSDKESLKAFCNIASVIINLCDIEKRAANLKSISLDKALNMKETGLTATAMANIKRYYEV